MADTFKGKKHTFSFEIFPPKTEPGYQKLLATLEQLQALRPDFISCTYGAGGGNRERTFDIVQHIQDKLQIAGVAHLTCVCHTKDEIHKMLEDIKGRGINNILALRGDPPQDRPGWAPGPENFKFSSELCAAIRRDFGDHFTIGVAGFPEGHPLCPDRNLDAKYLKLKIDSGADYVITQLFFNNTDYLTYVKRLRNLGVDARIIPGVMPITDYNGLVRFCNGCGTKITDEVKRIFAPIADDREKTIREGIKFAVRQGQALLHHGAPGLHFYILNKYHPIDEILKEIRR